MAGLGRFVMVQWIIVTLVVAACAAYLARMLYRLAAGKPTGCGCSECPAANITRGHSERRLGTRPPETHS